jgi:glycosyltransferase involved in cell wall biosynthesis
MFSVLVPVFNHAAYLPGGVLSALRSPLVSEVLLVDDGSSDGSARVAAALARSHPGRVRDLTRPGEGNRGAAARLRQLVGEAREEWVAVLNSDDAFAPARFELIRARCRRGDFELVVGHLLVMDEAGHIWGTKKGVLQPEYPFPDSYDVVEKALRGELVDLLANQNFVATTSNMVFTRSLHERVGGFRDLRFVHDWDFALRASLAAHVLYLPHFLAIYRSHARNTIKTHFEDVAVEVRGMFESLLGEHPALQQRPDFAASLRGNRYLEDARPAAPARAPR